MSTTPAATTPAGRAGSAHGPDRRERPAPNPAIEGGYITLIHLIAAQALREHIGDRAHD